MRSQEGPGGRVRCDLNLNGRGVLMEKWYLSGEWKVVREFDGRYLGETFHAEPLSKDRSILGTFEEFQGGQDGRS